MGLSQLNNLLNDGEEIDRDSAGHKKVHISHCLTAEQTGQRIAVPEKITFDPSDDSFTELNRRMRRGFVQRLDRPGGIDATGSEMEKIDYGLHQKKDITSSTGARLFQWIAGVAAY